MSDKEIVSNNKTLRGVEDILDELYDSAYYGAMDGNVKPEEIYQSAKIFRSLFREVADDISIADAELRDALHAARPHLLSMREHYPEFSTNYPIAAPVAFFREVVKHAEFPNKETLSPAINARIDANMELQAYRLKERLSGMDLKDSQKVLSSSGVLIRDDETIEMVRDVPPSDRSLASLQWRIGKETDVKGEEWLRDAIVASYDDGIECLAHKLQSGDSLTTGLMIAGESDPTLLPDILLTPKHEQDLIEKLRFAYGSELMHRAGCNLGVGGLEPALTIASLDASEPKRLTPDAQHSRDT